METTPPSAVLSSVSSVPSNPLVRAWGWLTTPHPSVPKDKRQRVSILMSMLVVFTPLAFVVVFSGPVSFALTGVGNPEFLPAAVFALILTSSAYLISRTPRHEIAGYMVVTVPIWSVLGVIFQFDAPPTQISLFFLSLSSIFSGLLFDARRTFVIGLISTTLVVLAYLRPVSNPEPIAWPIPLFILITTSVMAVVSRLTQGYVSQLESTQTQLIQQYAVAEEARERAERSDQVKSAFLASMSHELRTPLNAIINYTKFVNKGTMGPVTPEQVETLDEVIDSAKHLLNLINDVLDMSKIEAGSLTLFIEENVDLAAILNSATNTARALSRDKGLTVTLEIDSDVPPLRADRQRVLQAILNIVSNAVKFTEKGGVTLNAKRDGDEVVIAIRDTGAGIAPEDQAGVFEAFKQTKTGLRQSGGTGLGMPITKSLIEAHNGTIALQSAEGQGTTFTLRLPIKSDKLTPMPNA